MIDLQDFANLNLPDQIRNIKMLGRVYFTVKKYKRRAILHQLLECIAVMDQPEIVAITDAEGINGVA
jgi:hypothetical protein